MMVLKKKKKIFSVTQPSNEITSSLYLCHNILTNVIVSQCGLHAVHCRLRYDMIIHCVLDNGGSREVTAPFDHMFEKLCLLNNLFYLFTCAIKVESHYSFCHCATLIFLI